VAAITSTAFFMRLLQARIGPRATGQGHGLPSNMLQYYKTGLAAASKTAGFPIMKPLAARATH
jgi:hypothetical protein